MKRVPFCLSLTPKVILAWFVLAFVFSSYSEMVYAGCDDAVFGFNKYVKSSSQSAVFTENFAAANPGHNFSLLVFNGYNGANRISRGSVVVNGVQVVSSSDFSQQVDSFEKQIGTLQANNVMQITLQQGATGSFIVVQIIDRGSGLTSLSGRVLSTTDQPLEQAKLTVGRASTLTDRNGNFRLDSLPCGVQRVVVDGSGIKGQKTYSSVTELLTLAEGILNVLPRAIYLPEINLATAVTVPSTVTSDIVVSNPAVPGVSLEIEAGTQVIYPDGATEGMISITEVPLDKAPLGLPLDQQPYKIVTIQPEGVVFSQPATLTYPNVDNLQVGDRVQVMSSIPETGRFAPAGTATVDPSCVCPVSDPGSGLSASGWCYLIPEYPRERNPNPDRKKDPCKEAVGSEADVCNGALSAGHTLPPYRSLGVSRSVTLNYSSLAAQPRPILAAESTIYGYSAQPSTLSYQLAVNGIAQGNELFTDTTILNPAYDETTRQAVQFTASGLQTGVYPYALKVTANFPSMSASTYVGGETTVNNQSGSSFGAGWTLEGLERLYLQPSGDALVLQGDGSSAVFRNFGEGPVLDLALFWRDPLDAANVHLGSAGGGFLPAQLSEAGFQVEPGSYAFTGDFNQDSIPDLLGLTDPGTHAGQVYVLLGKGDGTFQRPIRSGRTFSSCGNRAFGDLNGDSLTDIIIRSDFVHPTPQETMVLFGNGDGTFRNVSRVVNGPFGTTIADFDQDSINDLMGGNYIYYGNGDGTFQPPVSTGEWPYYSSSSSADLNGDEIPDLIVNDPGPPTMPPYPPTMLIHVALNNGNGTFGPATTYETPRGARAVFDSNGDSHADLVCAHIESNSVTVLLGNGDGTFQAGIVSPGIPEPIQIAPADFTGDGVMDLGITRNASLIYYIARGNGNGTFTIIDQVDEMHGIPVVANFNGDFRGPGFIAPPGEYSRLVPNTDGTFTRILKDGTQIHFNANGFHTSTVDRNGNVTSFAYNPDGTLASITDPVNLVTSFSYNGSRLSSIQDPAGRTTSFAINGSGDLVQITNPDQTTVQFEYSDARFPHQMTARFDSKGNRTEYSYNFAGRFASSTAQSAAGPVVRSLAPAQLKGLVDPVSGQGTEGNPAPITRQAEVVATFTDANNHSTTYRFDDFGNPIEIVDAVARITTWVRDGEGNAVRMTRPNGAVSTMTYDDWGNLLTENDESIGATTTFTYEPNFNQITSVTDPRGKTTTINYDQQGNAIGITDDLGTLTEIVYSPNGLISSVTSALGQPEQRTTSFGYNPLGNLITATNPLLEATTFDYDNAGNVSVSTNAKNQTTLFIHNGMNRIESLQDADLKLTQFGYDFNGNLESVTDANQHTTIFTYDQSNRLTSTTNPLLATESYTYDPAGNLISILTRKGETISYEYDAADQLLHKTLPGSQVTSFGYNSAGNVTSVVDPDSAVQMVYDLAGRLTSTTASSPSMPAQTIGYTHDLNGNRLTMTDPQDGVTDYVYDALNRPTSIENPSHQTTTFGYDRLSRRTTLTHHNGVVSTYTYDGASQLLSLVHQLGGLTVNSAGYVYDPVGNRTSKTDNSGTATYSYDTVNRLIEALNPLPFNPLETYIYDPLGNRTDSNQNGLSTFNEANRLLEDASFVYQYDANGNMTRRTSKSSGLYSQFVYDAENQLTQVIREDGSIVNYHYDGLGRRIEKEVAGVITCYVYDSEDILLELDASNNVVARYTHGPGIDEPLILQKSGQSYFYHADGLGSVTDITDQSGTQVQAYLYSTFGQMAALNPSFSQPYSFTAREFDPETGLHYYRARYYDANIGRFLREDPLGFGAGPNFYTYASNSPSNLIDPFGLRSLSKCEKETLRRYFPGLNLDKVEIVEGLPWFSEFGAVEADYMALLNTIYSRSGDSISLRDLAHELTHLVQQRNPVIVPTPTVPQNFFTNYAGYFLINWLLNGFNPDQAYTDIPYEILANILAQSIMEDLKKRGIGTECPCED